MNEILLLYVDKFGYSPGIPWDGFPDEGTEIEYCDSVKECTNTGVSPFV